MKYSIEIGKIVEGALKHDQLKVLNYTKQLIAKLEQDRETRAANKFSNMLAMQNETSLSAMGMNKETNVPVDAESRTRLADVIYPTENNIEVILSKSNSEKLNSFILSYKYADKLNSLGIGVSNTLLLYGPPGCGKTKCAYLIAKELHLPLVLARLDSLISSYLGTTAKNIRTLFEFAQKTPCVLFLDEFDAIAKARDDSNELGELKRVVNSLLQNVDSMSSDSLLLAATNHDSLLDPAVWRRFDYKLEIELPDTEAIVKMIDLFINGVVEFSNKEKHELAAAFLGLSGANVEEIIKKSLRNAVIHENDFSKMSIYEELFNFKKILPQSSADEKVLLKIKANFLRECNEKVFSYAIIADILNVSKTTVSKLIKEEDGQ
ncbi:AAA family ATPase [Caproiciproducens galactitolivorans]|uniref:ATP-binding protein n=1 Tax=Caproiciproducens galactitolivorans TaxID=642589 RepID=A0ABT4BRY9_9FIRM|nr:ATP-binding protein [Caproiciproducens galactitolivorans]MCY1713658.1 ATP-binding protein [Caproiciproducens galactitolivorans]